MAGKEKRQATLRHLTRELVRENFSLTDIFTSLAESLDDQSKAIAINPKSREEADILEAEALLIRKLVHDHRAEMR